MKTILVKGPALSRSGYGEQTRFALRCLRAHEERFNILLMNISWGHTGWISEDTEERHWYDLLIGKTAHHLNNNMPIDMSLQITIPNEWEKLAPINIGYTAGIETTRVSPHWLQNAALMDKIIVVSNHSKNVFNDTVYDAVHNQTGEKSELKNRTPIEVVNYPVRSREKEPFPLQLDYDFNFLSVAQMGPRKNLANTIKWFVEEFQHDEVGLVLKANMANCSTGDKLHCAENMRHILKGFPERKCKIYLLHGDLTLEQMNYLYVHPKIKSYVTFTHGEGFGMPIFEAAYHGLPVIAPQWSGQCDFLHAPVLNKKKKKAKVRPLFCKVDYAIDEIPDEVIWDGVLERGTKWCYPTEISSKRCMRDVYKNYTRYVGMANKLKKHILTNFTEEKQYKKFANIVCEEEQFEIEDWLSSLELEVHE